MIKNRIKKIIWFLFAEKQIKFNDLNTREIHLNENSFEYIFSTSTTIKMSINNKIYYFRECIYKSNLKESILKFVEEFSLYYKTNSNLSNLKNSVDNDLKDKNNFTKIKNIKRIYGMYFKEMCSKTFCSFENIGLPSLANYNIEDMVPLLQGIKSIVINYDCNLNVKNGFCTYNASRHLATEKVANLFGLNDVIPEIFFCKLSTESFIKYGTLQEEAKGVSPYILNEFERKKYSSNFLKTISSLEFFDGICYQLDHRLDNINIQYVNDFINSVKVFDNDEYMAFAPTPFLPSKTYFNCSSLIKNHTINRPYIDEELYKKIMSITKKDLYYEMSELLTKIQLECLWLRLKLLKKALTKSISKICVVTNWESIDISLFLSEQYGKTYFNYYLSDFSLLDRIKELGG